MKTLIVIDVQNDFVTGSLGTPEAQAIIPNVRKKISEYRERNDKIIFTQDTHDSNYLETNEGKHLPVPHCIAGTDGWKIVEEYHFVACVREGQELTEALEDAGLMKYKDHFTEITIPENHTSSSLVRNLCGQGKFNQVKELVPENVYEYLFRFYDVMNRM